MAERVLFDNDAASRFELHRGGEVVSIADYRRRKRVLTIPHVETDPTHRGNGYAAELMVAVLERIRHDDLRIRPLCPFAASYLREHPEQQDLLAD
ncbi:MAG: GNAT family N-acetyltransferase [Ilumatobacteraceae bacterium]